MLEHRRAVRLLLKQCLVLLCFVDVDTDPLLHSASFLILAIGIVQVHYYIQQGGLETHS